jgi:serine/threonine protein kinase
MVCAVKHVHDCGFVHLDVKPTNFFVTQEGKVKLGDFGLAIDLNNLISLKDDDVEGDSVYMAPELLKTSLPLEQRVSPKADIFSLGTTLLEVASGMNLP